MHLDMHMLTMTKSLAFVPNIISIMIIFRYAHAACWVCVKLAQSCHTGIEHLTTLNGQPGSFDWWSSTGLEQHLQLHILFCMVWHLPGVSWRAGAAHPSCQLPLACRAPASCGQSCTALHGSPPPIQRGNSGTLCLYSGRPLAQCTSKLRAPSLEQTFDAQKFPNNHSIINQPIMYSDMQLREDTQTGNTAKATHSFLPAR